MTLGRRKHSAAIDDPAGRGRILVAAPAGTRYPLGMSLPRRARRIHVDGESYRWLVSSRDLPRQLSLLVQREDGGGARLRVGFAFVRIERPSPDGASRSVSQQTVSSPGFVRDAIRDALEEGWNPRLPGPDVVIPYDDGFRRPDWPMPTEPELVAWDPLVEMVVGHAPGSTRPSAEWVLHWSQGGRDPLAAAWEASTDPGVMLDVLEQARPAACRTLEAAFATRTGSVADLFARNPEDAPRSLHDDLLALEKAAQECALEDHEGAFHHEVIWKTDVGPRGDWNLFRAELSAVVRAIAGPPPTIAEFRPELVPWVEGVVGAQRAR